jgi:ATP-dependent exoDNAse (exonuclease V) beta subunit
LYNPIKFYKQKVLKIRELEDVEETVAFNTLGTVVHEALDELYTPFVGQFLHADAVSEMLKKARPLVEKQFQICFKNGELKTGKNRLIFEVANRFVVNFLQQEILLLKDENNQLKIIATEENLATIIEVEGLDFPIKIHGQVDRVDELNGVTRIIDYKTGMVAAANLKVPNFTKIRDEKYHKAIQVLLYAFLYTKNKKYEFNKPLEAGIVSFKNLKSGFLATNFSSSRTKDHSITEEKLAEFMEEIKLYLIEIYDLETPFIEPPDLKY